MADVKKTERQQVHTMRKKLYTFSIIILLISSVFPLIHTTMTPSRDSRLTANAIKTYTEQIPSNNFVDTMASVIPWWNMNWHYRRIYDITSAGNLSLVLNFTSILKSLQLKNKTFENSTITIVRHYANGTMAVVDNTWFNESNTFHNQTNAIGTLSWSVSGSSSYAIYFDVHENRGTRSPTTETPGIVPFGSVAKLVSTQAWWSELIASFETYYEPNTQLLIQLHTTAQAKNVNAQFTYNSTVNFTMPLNTQDNITWTNTTTKLSKIGNWTVRIIGYDDAGYQTSPITVRFYVGKPDLVASAIRVPKICYIGYDVTVTTYLRAINTTVENVDVALRIDDNTVDSKDNLTIQQNENKSIQFIWKPSNKGSHNVSYNISYLDSNPGNNKKWETVTVEGIPDLAVVNITLVPTPVNEGSPVAITAYIHNKGDGNASNYTIVLYCEQNDDNHTMSYLQNRNSTNVTLNKNTSKNITLTWQQTRYGKTNFKGEWAVGIEILNTTRTPDKNVSNNKKALFHVLRVIPAERNPPVLSNLEFLSTIELGAQVLIRVRATDTSGINTVVISIRTSNKTYMNANMTAAEDNRYEYLFTTVQLGRHDFTIKATDLSPNKNQSIITGYFTVTEDETPPTITYFGVNPSVQMPNRPVEIRCITTDYSGIRSAEVMIWSSDDLVQTHVMNTPIADTKYIYTSTYQNIGKYVFSITVTDNFDNPKTTEVKTFWITENLNDTDNDRMPDDWEERYGLNPYDPTDAPGDQDDDGITNAEEYQQGTNPLKKLSSPSEIIERLEENWVYLTASLLILILIILLASYGIRRRSK